MKHQIATYTNACRQCSINRERIEDNLASRFCKVTQRTRQRRQAHRQRLALGRARHQVHGMRRRLRRMVRSASALPVLRVPRIVRKHVRMLRRTLFED